MTKRNAIYAQSGGVTAVINATACGEIETARRYRNRIGKVLAGRDGIIGVLAEDLIDTSRETPAAIRGLPRYMKLRNVAEKKILCDESKI